MFQSAPYAAIPIALDPFHPTGGGMQGTAPVLQHITSAIASVTPEVLSHLRLGRPTVWPLVPC